MPTHTAREIGLILGITPSAVRERAKRLNLEPKIVNHKTSNSYIFLYSDEDIQKISVVKPRSKITNVMKHAVLDLFKNTKDNSTPTISSKLNLSKGIVDNIIDRYLKTKITE